MVTWDGGDATWCRDGGGAAWRSRREGVQRKVQTATSSSSSRKRKGQGVIIRHPIKKFGFARALAGLFLPQLLQIVVYLRIHELLELLYFGK